MNREQRRMMNEILCAQDRTHPWMLDASLILHGRWNRKSKPFAVGHLRQRRSIKEVQDWELLSSAMPIEDIDMCFALNGSVLYYDTPGFTQEEMINATMDKLVELDLDEEYAGQVHRRVMNHIYGGSTLTREYRRNRVCTCPTCSKVGDFPLKGRKGWRITLITLVNLLDLSKVVPPEIFDAVGALRLRAMEDVASPVDKILPYIGG